MVDKLYTLKEVAEILNIHIMSVRRLVWEGHLKAVEISRTPARKTYRIRSIDLEKFLKGGE